ncbi:hypothetical protein TNCV_1037321, partial [Trichonephila clavipes]
VGNQISLKKTSQKVSDKVPYRFVTTLSLLPTQPSKTARRNSRGAEEHRNRQYPAEQHQEEPKYGSLRRRSGG